MTTEKTERPPDRRLGPVSPPWRFVAPGRPPRVVRLKILNDRTAATELYLREYAAEIEEFSRSSDRHFDI